ncbi:MAG: TM0106 family RecB-like putative nuclease [Cyanobacteriota bacterium]|nr:TM0106 family RecB-like putative nuclease [Cyanobacteriota bacterium]
MLLSDDLLLDYKRCQRRAFLNVYGQRTERTVQREFLLKLQRENRKQIAEILTGQSYCQPHFGSRDWETGANQTWQLMKQGVELIYKGVLLLPSVSPSIPTYLGRPTLLKKQSGSSDLGSWHYLPINVKLGKRPKPEYKTIAAFHAYILARIQGLLPTTSRIVVRSRREYDVDLNNWLPRLAEILSQCYATLSNPVEPELFISRQRCSLCQWHSSCYAIASSQRHLSLVPGITPSRYQSLRECGVTSLTQLATVSASQIESERIDADLTQQLQQQARSLLADKPLPKPQFYSLGTLPTASVELYFDIEAEPERNLDYLLGVLLVDRQAKTEQFYPFLAETPEEEGLIWEQFLTLTERYSDAPIFHFSDYEIETVKRLGSQYQTPSNRLNSVLSRLVDLHEWTMESATMPVESYSLKSLAGWLGFQWRDRGASGEATVCWYDRWLVSGDRTLLEAIVRYNEDDCRATYRLKQWLEQFLLNAPQRI